MINAREEEKNDVDAVFVCFFVSARIIVFSRLLVPLACSEGTFVRNSKINASIILLFSHLLVPLTFGRRYFCSEVKINPNLFCTSLAYSYLCMRHQGCMADIGLAENIPSNDLNRVVPA